MRRLLLLGMLGCITVMLFLFHAYSSREADPKVKEHLKKTLPLSSHEIRDDNDKAIITTRWPRYKIGTDKIEIIIKNVSNEDLIGGFAFYLDVAIDDEWYAVNPPTHSTQLAIGIGVGETSIQEVDLSYSDFDWIPGRYRIIKLLFTGNGRYTTRPYAAEFIFW